jgi:hypothetical protein
VPEEHHAIETEVRPELVEVGDIVVRLVGARVGGRSEPSLPRGFRRASVKLEPRPARSAK